jgi:hypothetical protein
MSDPSVPLTIVSSPANNYYYAQIAIGDNVLSQQPNSWNYWFVVVDRRTLKVVYNQLQQSANSAPNLGAYNTSDYMLIVATLGVGLNNQPQGALFQFLDANGAGRQLRRVNQVAEQLNCGYLGTFGYALVSTLGDLNSPGFEASQIGGSGAGPILTCQLMPSDVNGQTYYSPVELSDA